MALGRKYPKIDDKEFEARFFTGPMAIVQRRVTFYSHDLTDAVEYVRRNMTKLDPASTGFHVVVRRRTF